MAGRGKGPGPTATVACGAVSSEMEMRVASPFQTQMTSGTRPSPSCSRETISHPLEPLAALLLRRHHHTAVARVAVLDMFLQTDW